MRTELTFFYWDLSKSKKNLIEKNISGEVIKETQKQLVIEEETTLSLFTINKSRIVRRIDYKSLF